jgi:hypothetical protein
MSGPTEVRELLHEAADRWAKPSDGPYELVRARAIRIRRRRRVGIATLTGTAAVLVVLAVPTIAPHGTPSAQVPAAPATAAGCGSPVTGMTTIAGTPWPANQELVAEGTAVPVEGWDFSWFEGRATEQRPSWGYARLMGERMTEVAGLTAVNPSGRIDQRINILRATLDPWQRTKPVRELDELLSAYRSPIGSGR